MKSQSQAIAVKYSPIHVGPVYTHLVTLVHPIKGDESLTVQTYSERFGDVMREIQRLKALNGLQGYEVFETLEINAPF
jgi:hypothetical protein